MARKPATQTSKGREQIVNLLGWLDILLSPTPESFGAGQARSETADWLARPGFICSRPLRALLTDALACSRDHTDPMRVYLKHGRWILKTTRATDGFNVPDLRECAKRAMGAKHG